MARKQLTSREVVGVVKAMFATEGSRLVAEYIARLHAALDEQDGNDLCGTQGWRYFLLGEDE